MTFHFVACVECGTKFHVRSIDKKKVGTYQGDIVYIDYLDCSQCGYKTIFNIDTSVVNKWSDKVFMLECNLHMYLNEPEKIEKILAELEIARNELNKISNEVKRCLRLKI